MLAVEFLRRRILFRGQEPSLQQRRALLPRIRRQVRQQRRLHGPPDHPATHQEAIDLTDLSFGSE